MRTLPNKNGDRSLYFDMFLFISVFKLDQASTACLAYPDGTPLGFI